MDSVKRSAVTPSKSRLARTFAKVLHIQAVTGVAPEDGAEKRKSHEKTKKDLLKKSTRIPSFEDDDDEELRDRAVREAFLAKLFASLSAIKAAYAQLQFAQSPYDADGIQSADQVVVSELKNLSELKQCYLKNQLNETSPEMTLLLSEIQEQKSLVKTYEITSKKLDSQLKLKDSEITFLKEKLADTNKDNRSLEKKLNSSGQLAMPENTQFSDLKPSHFITYLRQAVKSIRSFVRLLITEMESADWDLDAAASSIEPGITFWQPNHKCFAFEAFVCREMFDGFNHPNFSTRTSTEQGGHHQRRLFFDRFMELKSAKPADYLAWKPKSLFATFCRKKYLRLVHPKMEASLFGNLDHRNLVNSGDLPETPFFTAFSEMAKRIWLLHCLALSFDPEVSIFQVSKGNRFSEVYMESLSDEAFLSSDGTPETDPLVAFVVVPGFRIGATIVQCQVYLQ
ncbi:protein GRAVITROPIC IN THE LIGHT 1 [Sesamum angolense]|uniref:Protein GRAVITROPIC IN THE LIGHT 1 n=1 Tax=Sesamum angolense TaxID=2727404 RepID=A0AAE2BUI4_9LAMI|nr:protein GRAVITROPIC IN THE LIGHT 1 [Sesamum angolense]